MINSYSSLLSITHHYFNTVAYVHTTFFDHGEYLIITTIVSHYNYLSLYIYSLIPSSIYVYIYIPMNK